MTERYGYGYGDEPPGNDLPGSRRGGVTERHQERDHDDVREIDLTDDADDRDRRAEAELVDEEEDGRPDAVDGDDEEVREPDAATTSTSQFPPVDRDRGDEAAAASTSRYGGADDDLRPDLPADRADTPGLEREEPDLGPLDGRAADAHDDLGAASGPDAGQPGQGGAATASQVDRHEEEMAWSSDLDHPGADRGDEVELALPTPAPEPAADPLAPAAGSTGTEDAPTTGLASSMPATPAAVSTTLLASVDAESVRRQFLDIQAGFVDEPRQAVQQAGELVDDLVRQVTQSLTADRERLQGSLDDDTTSTEDLRLVLRAYRAYVDRLLGLAM